MNSKEKSVVITSAIRTAIGTFHGSLKDIQGHDLGSIVIKERVVDVRERRTCRWKRGKRKRKMKGHKKEGHGVKAEGKERRRRSKPKSRVRKTINKESEQERNKEGSGKKD